MQNVFTKLHPTQSKLALNSQNFATKMSAIANSIDNIEMNKGIDIGINKGIDIGINKGIDIGINKGIDIGNKGIDIGNKGIDIRIKAIDNTNDNIDYTNENTIDIDDLTLNINDIIINSLQNACKKIVNKAIHICATQFLFDPILAIQFIGTQNIYIRTNKIYKKKTTTFKKVEPNNTVSPKGFEKKTRGRPKKVITPVVNNQVEPNEVEPINNDQQLVSSQEDTTNATNLAKKSKLSPEEKAAKKALFEEQKKKEKEAKDLEKKQQKEAKEQAKQEAKEAKKEAKKQKNTENKKKNKKEQQPKDEETNKGDDKTMDEIITNTIREANNVGHQNTPILDELSDEEFEL